EHRLVVAEVEVPLRAGGHRLDPQQHFARTRLRNGRLDHGELSRGGHLEYLHTLSSQSRTTPRTGSRRFSTSSYASSARSAGNRCVISGRVWSAPAASSSRVRLIRSRVQPAGVCSVSSRARIGWMSICPRVP